ncbi:hypothetical protein MOV66_27720 [Agrobacterium sp. SHOUNA12C]|uniref:Uncharacterized protein n=1 Tax=Rhizobium rhizogenes NBRC 13257 TaxID=1220581 RepID=A0AA87QC71_RHIRH|nr:hypothetical protein [Rhizobium rhizogenes]MCJ9723748.1 hypothetical protein [Agrobacterium sp. BETTINA12B]MCJ9760458.1 hypothetical protein [Agrobacterium sp. SHOUNA12C]GAJ92828.1 hypothetical protein RRH01S_04_03820 [Rhizobium rhizogenes NBRC 13257]MDJ1635019.1 hypothetical protein [Rhizobium rhizogenes]WEO64170.1 hypothetical protein G6L54_013950 [Rhizobium rhizogenes]
MNVLALLLVVIVSVWPVAPPLVEALSEVELVFPAEASSCGAAALVVETALSAMAPASDVTADESLFALAWLVDGAAV